jgi:D-sedoheptulose 7-phosphate isomerase
VIVGKRALPAFAIAPADVALLAEAGDVAVAFGAGAEVTEAVAAARRAGCLTIAFAPVGAEWELIPPAGDPLVAQELVETLYHVLWELVHVFFEHRGLLAGRAEQAVHDPGASSFLYPSLGEREDDLDAVVADVRASALAKAAEVGALREQTLREGRTALEGAAGALRACFDAGGKLLALGNGGSATDAMDAVADLRSPPRERGWPARPALDLAEDPAILTAIANDVGPEALFARQVIAYGGPGDALLAFSTSGGSANVLAALSEARRRRLATVAFVGYDGGRIAAEGLAEHVVVTRSEHIPRIQEAQASAWHVLRELVEDGA